MVLSEASFNVFLPRYCATHHQRAFTILDMERTLPTCLIRKLRSGSSKMVCFTAQNKRFFRSDERMNRPIHHVNKKKKRTKKLSHLSGIFDNRVLETNWKQWRSDLGYVQDEDPGDTMSKPESNRDPPRGTSTPHSPHSGPH